MIAGATRYQQTSFNPYRLICQVQDQLGPVVFVVVVADGRRDMTALLQRLLLNPPI